MDAETLVLRVVREAVARLRYRMPIHTAAVGRNGAVLFTEFTPAPLGSPKGSVSQTHIVGKIPDDGFEAPIHVMVTDATGRSTLAVVRGDNEPVFPESP